MVEISAMVVVMVVVDRVSFWMVGVTWVI